MEHANHRVGGRRPAATDDPWQLDKSCERRVAIVCERRAAGIRNQPRWSVVAGFLSADGLELLAAFRQADKRFRPRFFPAVSRAIVISGGPNTFSEIFSNGV